GWAPDAPRGRATLAPQLPPDWGRVAVRHLGLGDASLDVEVRREPGGTTTTVTPSGRPLTLDVVTAVPAGAGDVRATLDGTPVPAADLEVTTGAHDRSVTVELSLDGAPRTVEVAWSGGLEVVPPRIDLVPGQESRGLRVVDFTAEDEGWVLTVEGDVGRDYGLDVVGAPVVVDGGPARITAFDGRRARTSLGIRLEGGTGRTVGVIRLAPGGP
ncbi:MAG TPA: hypothetical protein VE173_13365, partial [Longimicrobiales bacterium]|nr:hypothetical protein [Longimicrobiales bacterium]